MNDGTQARDEDALAQAQATIARQAAEIERLRGAADDQRFAMEVREALALAATAGAIAAPVTHTRLLEMIIETAAHVIPARAAALFLLDEGSEELVFEVAIGPEAQQVRQFRVPLGRGIAGLVAATGQPMAISDARSDPRHATEIGQSVGHVPDSILCVPLFYKDRTIGVIELMDRQGARSFSAADIESLGLFANQAAVAIEQSRMGRSLAALVSTVLQGLGKEAGAEQRELSERAQAFAGKIEEDTVYRQSLDLAALVREIASQGEHELTACHVILRGFAEYLNNRRGSEYGPGESW